MRRLHVLQCCEKGKWAWRLVGSPQVVRLKVSGGGDEAWGEGLEGRCRLEHPLNGLDSVLFMKLTKQMFLFSCNARSVQCVLREFARCLGKSWNVPPCLI